jgi:hypothetical protein
MAYTPIMVPRISLFLVITGLATAQVNSNSVTVTASRGANLQPDEVVFRVSVNSGLDATRDDALNALQGTGITQANFAGVSTVQQFDAQGRQARQRLEWVFSLPVPLASMKSTIGLLAAAQASNAQKKNGLDISFGVVGVQVSQKAQQSQQCALADLISDARAQAQKVASAAGRSVGSVLAISGGSVASGVSGGIISSAVYLPVCSLTVRFQLAGF